MIHSTPLRPALSAFSLALLGACNSERALTTPTAAPPTDSLAAKFRPLVGQIAFNSTRDGSTYIYVAAADGSSLRRLAAGVSPAWSWDGRQIAFNGFDSTSAPPIYVINVDGSGQRLLPLRGSGPAWSPDGRHLAYSTDSGIYVANSDGSNPRQLVSSDFPSPGETVGGQTWSPDGTRIAFVSGDWDYTSFQLYVVNVDGTGILPLTPYDPKRGIPNREFSANWSPDGSMVACTEVFGATTALGIANADGSLGQTASTSVPFPETPDWSPDGRILSFTGWTAPGTRIFATDPALGATIQLIPNAISPARRPYDDFNAVWSRAVQP
jgi:Tol biopolymer transport system component